MASDANTPPSREVIARQLGQLESRVDEAVALIARLRKQQSELEARLAESERVRREAAQRVQVLLDRIDGLG